MMMTCDFTSFSTVLQSYQEDERLIMKSCAQLYPKAKRNSILGFYLSVKNTKFIDIYIPMSI